MADLHGPWIYRRSRSAADQWEIGYPHPLAEDLIGIHGTERDAKGEALYFCISGICTEAHARAIGAVPDLIDGIEGIRDLLEEHINDIGASVQEGGRLSARERTTLRKLNRALAALAKAKGE